MKKRKATIICLLMAICAQIWCSDQKYKSAYIDSLNTDVENHIYDKDVTKRIDKLMKASKEAQDETGIAQAYKQYIFVTSLWQGKHEIHTK